MTPTERAAKVAEIRSRYAGESPYHMQFWNAPITASQDIDWLLSIVAELEAELTAEKLRHSFDLHRIDAAVSRLEQIK